MERDSNDLMVVELEPETDMREFVEETSGQDQAATGHQSIGNSAVMKIGRAHV